MKIQHKATDGTVMTGTVGHVDVRNYGIRYGVIDERGRWHVEPSDALSIRSGNPHDDTEHVGHDIWVAYPNEAEADTVVWCDTCSSTLEYLDDDYRVIEGAW